MSVLTRMPDFTMADIMAALAADGPPAADLTGFATAEQWADRLGCSDVRMHRLIRDALAKGFCEHRKIAMSELGLFAIDGSDRRTNVYAFRVQLQRSPEEGNSQD